jgi:hypothetical protein
MGCSVGSPPSHSLSPYPNEPAKKQPTSIMTSRQLSLHSTHLCMLARNTRPGSQPANQENCDPAVQLMQILSAQRHC